MIKLHFQKLSKYNREYEPCTAAVPFPKGILTDTSEIVITDGSEAVPSQFKVTARWEDKSVKWLLIYFLANLPGNKGKDYFLYIGSTPYIPATKNRVSIKCTSGRLKIDTGKLLIELCRPDEKGIFNKVALGSVVFENNEITPPIIYNSEGEAWEASIGEHGWSIIENGPVCVISETKGKHKNSMGDSWIDYALRIYAYAGKPWVKLDYQILNKESGTEQEIKGIEIKYRGSDIVRDKVKTAIATSNYASKIEQGTADEKLCHIIDANSLVYEANEHFPETFYGTFWADWRDKSKGICASVYQAHQNFPKALETDNKGIIVKLLPCESGGFKLKQGMAKTASLLLHFHKADETMESLNVRSLQFQLPDRPVIDAGVYKSSGVFDDIFADEKVETVERFLINLADARGKAYGILHWGDAPDPGYTEQGRGNGEPVWTNNEYDFPHAAMLMYAKCGERRMQDYMLVAAEHWMNVDVCHYSEDPLRHQAQIIHSASHVTGEVEISHEWVEGLFDYYHQTGDAFAYDTAIGIGENILRHLERPKYHKKGGINARETGWALRALVALYFETYDDKWIKPAEKIIEHFRIWKEEFGGWLAPYTDHTAIRVPFMISIAVGSLMRYYRIRPDEEIKNMIIAAVDDMLENCILENGLFYYKELPSLRRLGNNTLVLEALSDAYILTGDVKYLKAGLPTFRYTINNDKMSFSFTKKAMGDTVILQGPGPKNFAQTFYPVTLFYTLTKRNNLLSE